MNEGDHCPECEEGILYYPPVENCTCHIHPPCPQCVNRKLECLSCGWEEEED